MKKKLGFFLIFLSYAFLGLAGCGSQASPSEVVGAFLDAVKADDADTIAQVYEGDSIRAEDFLREDGDDYSEEVLKQMGDTLRTFDYEIEEETVEGDTAHVKVTFTAYNYSAVMNNVLARTITEMIAVVFSDKDKEEQTSEAERIYLQIFNEEIEKNAESRIQMAAELSLKKADQSWVVQNLSDEEMNAMYGGLPAYYDSLNSLVGTDTPQGEADEESVSDGDGSGDTANDSGTEKTDDQPAAAAEDVENENGSENDEQSAANNEIADSASASASQEGQTADKEELLKKFELPDYNGFDLNTCQETSFGHLLIPIPDYYQKTSNEEEQMIGFALDQLENTKAYVQLNYMNVTSEEVTFEQAEKEYLKYMLDGFDGVEVCGESEYTYLDAYPGRILRLLAEKNNNIIELYMFYFMDTDDRIMYSYSLAQMEGLSHTYSGDLAKVVLNTTKENG